MAKALRHKRTGYAVWGVVGLVMLGLGGFGVTNFGGSSQKIGTVGDEDIASDEYFRALQGELRAFSAQVGQQVGFQQAQALGLDRSVLGQLVLQKALDAQAQAMGLGAGDAQVRDQIVAAEGFKGMDGKFDKQLYEMALRQQGLTATKFEAGIRADAARSLLQGAIVGGITPPSAYVDAIARYTSEQRGFHYVRLGADQLASPVPAPTEDALAAYHKDHPAEFTAPETRKLSYAWLSPDMVLDQVKLDDATLRAEYDRRKDEFVQPEKRMVERLVFSSEAEAQAAMAEIQSGAKTFQQLTEARGLSSDDIDLGELARADLGAAGDAVFGLTAPGVVGPFASNLGPALFQMNGIIDAKNVSFEAAKPDLGDEVKFERARALIQAKTQEIDDELAGGATLEELAKDQGMTLGKVDVTAQGTGEGIAAYQGFRQAAMAAQQGDFPQLAQLDDGGVFALTLDEIVPPTLRPLAEVRDQVLAAWTREATVKALTAQAEALAKAPDFDAAVAAAGLAPVAISPVTRDGYVEALPADGLNQVFAMKEGEARAIAGPDAAFAVKLDSVAQPAADDADAARVRAALETQSRQSLAQDAMQMFGQAAQARVGVSLNQQAITAVNAQMN